MPFPYSHSAVRPVSGYVSLFLFLIFSVTLPSDLHAQNNPNLDQGLTPFHSYDAQDIDSISLISGNLNLHIPIISYPQRGSIPLSYQIGYNDKNWFVNEHCPSLPPPNTPDGPCTLGWEYRGSGVTIINTGWMIYGYGPLIEKKPSGTMFTAYTSDGSSHWLLAGNGGLEAADGTQIWSNGVQSAGGGTIGGTVRSNNGTSFTNPAVYTFAGEDANGNQINYEDNYAPFSVTTDTMGRTFPQTSTGTSDFSGCITPIAPAQITYASILSLPGPNGVSLQVKACSAQYTFTFTSGSLPVSDDNGYTDTVADGNSGIQSKAVSIVTYNGISWSSSPAWGFNWTSFGSLSQVTYPTGGTVSYGWGGVSLCPNYVHLTPYSLGVVSRTVNAQDGTGPHATSYVYGATFGANFNYAQGTLATDPNGNDTVHILTDLNGGCSLYETQTLAYLNSYSSGTLLKTVNTDYQFKPNPFASVMMPPSAVNVFPIRKTTIWPNKLQTKVETDYDTQWGGTYTPSFGNVIAIREYDYGTGAPGPLLRTTTNTYIAFTNSAYMSANLLGLLASSTITNGSGAQIAKTTYNYDATTLATSGISTQHDTTLATPGTRGNLTSVCKWLNTTGTSVCTNTSYYDTGKPYQVTDPLGHTTTYAFSSTYAGAYVTQTTMPSTGSPPVSHTISGTYDFDSGNLLSFTDQNGKVNNYTYDALARLATATFPDLGSSTFTHVDTPLAVSVEVQQGIASGLIKDSVVFFDGLGRKSQTELKSDPDGATFTNTTYDPLGRVYTQSNPHRSTSSPTDGLTTYFYDPLGRACLVVPPDGTLPSGSTCPTTSPANDTFTTYSANVTIASDQAGKSRESLTDGLSRLTQVFEDPAGLNYETDYAYDALNNLLSVNQKGGSSNSALWRTRSFSYDSLSRLTQATNPESGTISYSYDANGNLLQKTSPAPNQTGSSTVTLSYCYDALNRVTGKAYTAQTCSSGLLPTPLVSYFYDQSSYNGLTITNGIGRRTGMSDQAGAEAWSYDVMGRAVSDARTTNSLSKIFTYSYNLDGSTAMLGYPTGANNTYPEVIAYQPGGAGRPLSLTSNGAGFVGDAHYTPSGANCYLQDYWDGTWTSVGTFNNRQQPKTYQVVQQSSGTPPTVCTAMTTLPGTSIMDFSYNFVDASSHNNGNVQTISNNLDWHRTQSFSYDSLNRISTAFTAADNTPAFQGDNSLAMCWAESFTYDAWGNLVTLGPNSTTQPNYVGCTQESGFNYTGAIGTNNRIAETGFTYDAAGNMTVSPALAYVYDAENHLTQTAGVTYTYDGDGKRVMKSNGTVYWYGAGSDPILETSLSASLKYQYFYFGGQRVGRKDGNNSVTWYFGDHLGSSRVVWSTAATDNSDFYPFGGERVIVSGTANTYKFTGKERDAESGLDNFGARYNSSTMGRWMSADPKHPNIKHLVDPQKWNKYAYVLNNPLSNIDPDGEEEISITFRAFIPQENVGGFRGDNRSFSSSPNASSRVSVTVKVETDPSKNGGHPMIGMPQVTVQPTHLNLTGGEKTSSGPQTSQVTATQGKDGTVTVNVQENMRNPYQPVGQGISSNVNISVNESATKASVTGTISGAPSFETNFTTQAGTTTNLPLQAAPQSTTGFILGLQQTNQVAKRLDLKTDPQ